jgi:hypothetical protein
MYFADILAVFQMFFRFVLAFYNAVQNIGVNPSFAQYWLKKNTVIKLFRTNFKAISVLSKL